MDIQLIINKALVMDEVAKTSSYVGAKAADDGTIYEHTFTTDEDRVMLERFWLESCATATNMLKPILKTVKAQPMSKGDSLDNNYQATLAMPSNWDQKLQDSVTGALFSFFANNIVAKWFIIASKDDAESYATTAAASLADAEAKLFYRKRPTRPTYTETITPISQE